MYLAKHFFIGLWDFLNAVFKLSEIGVSSLIKLAVAMAISSNDHTALFVITFLMGCDVRYIYVHWWRLRNVIFYEE